MIISLCMRVWNEERLLATAVESTRGLADELVIVDTGSDDGTVALARKLGARVIEGGDRMHAAAARNTGLDAAAGDWVVILDADERIADPAGLRRFLEETDADAVFIRSMFMAGDRPTIAFSQMRCWRRGTYRYQFRTHEVPVGVDGPKPSAYTDFVFEHRPPAERWEQKKVHALERLLVDVEENPGEPRCAYYLGRQYQYVGEWKRGIEWLERYLEMTQASGGWDRGNACWHIAVCWKGLGDERRQIEWLHRACAEKPMNRQWWGELAEIYHARGENEIAAGLLRCALEIPLGETAGYAIMEWHGARVYDLLARCLWGLERYEEGRGYAARAVELAPEDERLRRNLWWFEERLAS